MDLTSLDTYCKIGDGRDQAQRGIFTWANDRDNEGFIQERRDRFFGSPEYLIFFDAIVVTHMRRQVSNHALIVLDPNTQQSRSKTRFIFHSRWRQIQECEEIIKQVWEAPFQGSNMYRMQQKIKR